MKANEPSVGDRGGVCVDKMKDSNAVRLHTLLTKYHCSLNKGSVNTRCEVTSRYSSRGVCVPPAPPPPVNVDDDNNGSGEYEKYGFVFGSIA